MAINSNTSKVPLFVVAGMPRSGTTFLYHNLSKHPQIFLPFRKEVNYFNDLRNHMGLEWFLDLYKNRTPDQICGDISPTYFLDDKSIERIKAYSKDVKVILGIRDPIEYSLSFYSQFQSFKYGMPEFAKFLDGYKYQINDKFVEAKFKEEFVSSTIRKYMEAFGDNLLIYDFRLLRQDPLRLTKAIEKFLSIDPFFDPGNFDSTKINASSRKNVKFLSNFLAQEWVIAIIRRVFPEKLIVSLRKRFDKKSGQKNQKQEVYYQEENKAIAIKLLGQDARKVQELFEKSPLVLGNRVEFEK